MFAPLIAIAWLPQGEPIQELAAKYRLKIEEIQQPLDWQGDGYKVNVRPASPEQLKVYESTFIKEWSLYPPSYVRKAEVHRVVFGVGLAVNGQVRAAVPAFDGD